jgi:N-methylhydantoinase B
MSAGTMSNLSLGGRPEAGHEGFSFYETLPGGAGAGAHGPGTSAVQTHMTNTRNTPVEELERGYPLRVLRLTVRRGSGGGGRARGGDGLVKEIEALAPMTASLFAERHRAGPAGSSGGGPGAPGRARLRRRGRWRRVPAKSSHELDAGDRLTIETPGGGGWGRR